VFSFDISDELREVLSKIAKKDPARAAIISKKIEQIINCDENTIDRFKNLRHDLSDYKRVHVCSSFVLLFQVFKKEKMILFAKLKHHDDAYK
jgi:YafQ family addiction module toxin component